ncbi:NAD(P)-binding protein [Natronomonas sp. CBA1123]|uniref:NAD(P)-binding protein n=1 Tax=Natronomonas sp. CBA1123 TaxID=2668070 RepID=UPI00351B12E9
MNDPDVVVVGAGADGPVAAWKLARDHNVDVLLLEAGPFYGNEEWPEPHVDAGGTVSTDPDDLDGKLLDEQFTHREAGANDPTYGYLRVGPSNSARAPWFRNLHQNAFIWQVSAVGGTSTHYFFESPARLPAGLRRTGPLARRGQLRRYGAVLPAQRGNHEHSAGSDDRPRRGVHRGCEPGEKRRVPATRRSQRHGNRLAAPAQRRRGTRQGDFQRPAAR